MTNVYEVPGLPAGYSDEIHCYSCGRTWKVRDGKVMDPCVHVVENGDWVLCFWRKIKKVARKVWRWIRREK